VILVETVKMVVVNGGCKATVQPTATEYFFGESVILFGCWEVEEEMI
jgi:hypothetical protein